MEFVTARRLCFIQKKRYAPSYPVPMSEKVKTDCRLVQRNYFDCLMELLFPTYMLPMI